MKMSLKLIFLAIFIACYLTESSAKDCQTFRSTCSQLCFSNVENDQCWGSPRYTQCVCNDGTIHQLPDYPCEHPDCPKDVVKGGTTRKPINREVVSSGTTRKPVEEVVGQANVPIISNDCQYFRSLCSDFCFTNVENDQCWGSPRYTQCICTDGTIHQLPEFPCEHPECPKDVVRGGTTRKPINRAKRPIRNRSKVKSD